MLCKILEKGDFMKKKIFTSISTTILMMNFVNVNAQGLTENSDDHNVKTLELAEAHLSETGENLSDFIKEKETNINTEDVKHFFEKQEEVSPESLQALQDKVEKETTLLKKIGKSDEEIADSLIEKEYNIDEKKVTLYKNGMYSIEESNPSSEEGSNENPDIQSFSSLAKSSKKSVPGSNTKSYYSIANIKLFTVSVSAKFYYNGAKAWYRSGLDGYSKRGTLSVWQVTNFKTARESDGTSYVATASGNFSYGFSYKGVGINIKEVYIKHEVRCTKNGNIKKGYVFR